MSINYHITHITYITYFSLFSFTRDLNNKKK